MSEHEHSDVHPGAIALAGVGLAIFLVAAMAVSVLLYRFFGTEVRHDQQRMREEPGAAALVSGGPGYDGALLQIQPERELALMRAENDRALTRFAWVDKPAGIVRIPIDLAMRRLVEQGLPPVSPPVTMEELQRQRGNPEPGRQLVPPP